MSIIDCGISKSELEIDIYIYISIRIVNINSPIDIFAVRCILSELLTQKLLFPGTNEVDQLEDMSLTLKLNISIPVLK